MSVNIGEDKKQLNVSANPDESISDIVSCLGHYIEFVITEEEVSTDSGSSRPNSDTVDLFQMMMATQRNNKHLPAAYPELKPNRKIQLKNDILKWLEKNELGWS